MTNNNESWYAYQILSTGQSLAVYGQIAMQSAIQNKFLSSIGNTPTVSNHGVGGTAYSGLKKGTTPYSNGMTQLNDTHIQAQNENKTHQVIGVTTIHGEADEWNNVTADQYKGYLTEWQRDYETDIKSVTNQIDTIPLYTCQMSSTTLLSKTNPQIAIGQLSASEENPDKIILVGPKYFLNYIDGIHLDDTNDDGKFGSKLLSEYYAKVMDLVFRQQQQWKPLSPIDITRTENIILARFHIPQGASWLVFDTTLVDPMPNMGFEYSDDANSSSISSVEIVGSDTVKITLNQVPTWLNPKLSYAYTGTPGAGAGAHSPGSLKGNLRDNDTTVAMFDPSVRLYNWAVHFSKPVALATTCTLSYSPAMTTVGNTIVGTISSQNAVSATSWCWTYGTTPPDKSTFTGVAGLNWSWNITEWVQHTTCYVAVKNSAWSVSTCNASYEFTNNVTITEKSSTDKTTTSTQSSSTDKTTTSTQSSSTDETTTSTQSSSTDETITSTQSGVTVPNKEKLDTVLNQITPEAYAKTHSGMTNYESYLNGISKKLGTLQKKYASNTKISQMVGYLSTSVEYKKTKFIKSKKITKTNTNTKTKTNTNTNTNTKINKTSTKSKINGKCGDGTCDTIEKKNLKLCPTDCQ